MPIYKVKGKKNKFGEQKYNVRINYIDDFGVAKQPTKVAYGLQNAKNTEIEMLRNRKEPTTLLKVIDLYDLYIKARTHEVRETTLAETKSAFKWHILPFLEKVKIIKLNAKTLNAWKTYMYEKKLSNATNQRIYGDLRAMLAWGVKSGYIKESPMKYIDNFKEPYFVHKQEKIQYYTAEQFKIYIGKALELAEESKDYNFYVFFNIAFFTGMRKGEINALTWKDFQGNKINITKSISQKMHGEDRITPPKNKSSYRTLQMPATLMNILFAHKQRLIYAHNFSLNSFVCSCDNGKTCLRDTSIDYQNRKYAKLANLDRIRIHDFRHTHATLLANSGINIQEIARRLGHSNIEETWNTYSHLYPKEEEKAIEILDNI